MLYAKISFLKLFSEHIFSRFTIMPLVLIIQLHLIRFIPLQNPLLINKARVLSLSDLGQLRHQDLRHRRTLPHVSSFSLLFLSFTFENWWLWLEHLWLLVVAPEHFVVFELLLYFHGHLLPQNLKVMPPLLINRLLFSSPLLIDFRYRYDSSQLIGYRINLLVIHF